MAGALEKGKTMLPRLETSDTIDTEVGNGSLSNVSAAEYAEYQELKEVFVGSRLQKLVHKIE